MTQSNLAISILNWNGLALTIPCVESILRDSTSQPDIYILDNGSTNDETTALRQRLPDRVTIERGQRNLGFAGGHNYVIKQLLVAAPYSYIALVNQDTIVEPGCYKRLVAYLEANPRVAVAGPLVLENTADTIQSCGAMINLWTGKIISRYQGQARATAPTEARLVDCIIGNCFVIRTAALSAIGLLDEGYFAYYEEADWCVRAKQRGWQCAVVPQAEIRHARAGGFRTYYITRNMIWFEKKHAAFRQKLFFWFYFWCRFIPERLLKKSKLTDLVRGAWHGWLRRKPKME